MQIMVERKLLDHSLHGRGIVAIHSYPAPAAVAANGVHLHYLIVQQLVDERPVAGSKDNKVLINGLGQADGNDERRHGN